MIYLSLPHFYKNGQFNLGIKRFIQKFPNARAIDFNIISTHGSFPYCYWNGDVNNNTGNLALYNTFYQVAAETINPLRFNCSNINLIQTDLNDIHQNTIFQLCDNGGNFIEVSDLSVYEYLANKYPNYGYILSENIELLAPITIETINTIISQDKFYLVTTPRTLLNDLDGLKQLENKKKCEIILGKRCNCNTEAMLQCVKQEQNNQILFSEKSIFSQCANTNTYQTPNALIDEIEKYKELGFTYFKVDSCVLPNLAIFNKFLVSNLIKPEYQLDCWEFIFNQKEVK